MRVFLTHLYVIVMAFIVLTASHIVAEHYGDDVVNSIQSWLSSADEKVIEVQDSVQDWNKDILD